MTIKVSIITVCFNSDDYLERTIQSVRNQTYGSIEYVIIDGGSTDSTVDIIQENSDVVSYSVSEPDRGIYDAMNKGIRRCTGDVVYFLNSDDSLFNETIIENIADIFERDPTIDLVYGNVQLYDPIDSYRQVVGREISIRELRKGIMPCHPGLFIKRNIIEKFLFNEEYKIASDFDLIVKCFLNNCKSYYTDETIATFQVGGASNNRESAFKPIKEKQKIIKQHFSNLAYLRYMVISSLSLIRIIARNFLLNYGLLKYWRLIKRVGLGNGTV